MQQGNWDIKCVLADPSNSIDVLFWDTFQKLQLNPNDIKMFSGSLTGLLGEHVQIMSYITLGTTYSEGIDARMFDVSYLTIDVLSPYNIILGWPTINALGEIVSIMYLTLKYPLPDG